MAAETIEEWDRCRPDEAKVNAYLARSRAVVFILRHNVPALIDRADICIHEHVRPYVEGKCKIIDHTPRYVELLIVDEAERLTTTALEWLRDLFDRPVIWPHPDRDAGNRQAHGAIPSSLTVWASPAITDLCRIKS